MMDKFLSTLPYGALFLPTLQKDIDRIDARLAGPKEMKRLAIEQYALMKASARPAARESSQQNYP